jgi:phospholipid/cholesterol/gamma-HCH transport system substrate-binding protein
MTFAGQSLAQWGRGVVLVAIVAGALVMVAAIGTPAYSAKAVFANVGGLAQAAGVEIDGVAVGEVKSLRLNSDDSVTVEFGIDAEAAPLGHDATATVSSKNVLGAKVLDIDPGDASGAPAPSGSTIPVERTGLSTNLSEILAVLDTSTRASLQVLINEAGEGLSGRADDFGELLAVLPDSLEQTSRLVGALGEDNRSLANLLTESHQVVSAVAQERPALARLIQSANRALAATSADDDNLAATISNAPGALRELSGSLGQLEDTARPLQPMAAALQRSAQPLAGVLRELPRVRGEATAALHSVAQTAPELGDLADTGTPLLRGLAPTSKRLERFSDTLAPTTKTLDLTAPDLLAALEGWARATQTRDGLGFVFRGSLILSPVLLESLVQRFVVAAPTSKSAVADAGHGGASGSPSRGGSDASRPSSHDRSGAAPADEQHQSANRPSGAQQGDAVSKLLDFLLGP